MLCFFVCENLLTEANSILRNAYKEGTIEYSASGSSAQWINGLMELCKKQNLNIALIRLKNHMIGAPTVGALKKIILILLLESKIS